MFVISKLFLCQKYISTLFLSLYMLIIIHKNCNSYFIHALQYNNIYIYVYIHVSWCMYIVIKKRTYMKLYANVSKLYV